MPATLWSLDQIPRDAAIHIYGAGGSGRLVRDALARAGRAVAGFIDSFRDGTADGLPVRRLETYLAGRGAADVILIAAEQHDAIAETLRGHGIGHAFNATYLARQLLAAARGEARPLLDFLPGSGQARVALPLDYPPSRAHAPRWGFARPPIAALEAWFAAHEPAYRRFYGEMCAAARDLADLPRRPDPARAAPAWTGVALGPFDSLALYTMLKTRRPGRYLEIGSGVSTGFARRAIADHGLETRLVSIDPAPRAAIDDLCDEVIRDGLEACDPALFDRLAPGDILFLDGSHRAFMNSDVTVFMIDILPRLRPGVIVHVHDIHLPYDYPPQFADWHWNEQYLLAVYLMAAMARLDPLLPTAFICRDARLADLLDRPPLDLGSDNPLWRSSGSLWFTHVA